ncbi:class I SAM-dependent methyltransferase [Leucobacter coleopterorum]|uniref:Class I SAM-dependent methyltransferase n=2 Tax=Leucobacter coleopterorum TaxID=2714933 RepID=A0ABX6JZN9_9MICO|nr:class I SAM-dependent methyltransferase [Leucobacter coleopterorum]
MGATHSADREFVLRWARRCVGPVIDAGCGPGHWTEFLRLEGIEVEGVDCVPEFISEAEQRYPDTLYRLAVLPDLEVASGALRGVLAWYSLIHLPPEQMGATITSLAKFLQPGGELALGFFEGPEIEPFEHAVVTAYFWPINELVRHLESAGFEIVEIDMRADPHARSHGAISARLSAR